jgi:2-C-methyl-D-erythritol 4-phosphate cytidylyltransferase
MTDHRWQQLAADRLTDKPADKQTDKPADVVWSIVVAGGSGSRYGGPKTQEILAGQRILDWSIRAAKSYAHGVVLVVSADRVRAEHGRAEFVVEGGNSRAESVRCGLALVPDNADIVMIHDAARPLATPQLFERVADAVRAGADGAIPAIPVVDTIKRVEGERVRETVDRTALVAVQTPQAFRASVLRQAHAGNPEATDDAGLVEAVGGTVVVVAGEERNRKITTPSDLAILSVLANLPTPAFEVSGE